MFSLKKCLGDPVKIRQWNTFGLPTDELSIQNGLFVEWGRRWPLMIDPQSQANRWIKAMGKSRKLRVVKLTQGDFLRTLENCIRVGQPVLMENVEESLDPSLEPLLLKQTYKKGGRLVLRLGDSDVDYVEDFKFYLTSKLPNPHYAPATQVKVTIVNFTVTQKGLENQLLAQVVALERPDLEEQAASLTMQINDGQNEVYNLEGTILKLLSEAGDDMLDDDVLINTLDNAKKTSNEISAQVKEAEATGKLIEETRELYRPAACRGSVLYFAVADMGKIDYMYQYSLQYFSKLFCFNIQNSEANADVGIRVETIIKVITVEIFLNICRGLFERDKILFASVIAFSVLRNSEQILPTEWSYFISGSGILDYAGLPEWTGGAWLFTKPAIPAAAEKTKDQLEAKRIFDLIDTSKDGLVSLEELMLYLLDQGMEAEEISDLFQGLDEDHDGVLTLEEWEKGFSAYKAGMDKNGVRMLVCYVCGGQHGIASLLIHQKQCLANYEKCNGHPFAGPPPELPVPGPDAKMSEVVAYNAQAQALYSGTMPKCASCGRKFATQAKVDQHSKTCKGGTSAQFLQKGSGGGGGVKGKVASMGGGGEKPTSSYDP